LEEEREMGKFTRFVGALVVAAMMSLAVSPVAAQGPVVNENQADEASSICALIQAALIFIGELPDSRGIAKLEAKLQEQWVYYGCSGQ
jgi:hypothetical protein